MLHIGGDVDITSKKAYVEPYDIVLACLSKMSEKNFDKTFKSDYSKNQASI